MSVTLTSIERAYGFLTIWGLQHPQVKELGATLYPKLPEELQKINDKKLNYHNEALFHPHGVYGRNSYRHFHIVYPRKPTEKDVQLIKKLIGEPGLKEEWLDDHINPNLNKDAVIEHSVLAYVALIKEVS